MCKKGQSTVEYLLLLVGILLALLWAFSSGGPLSSGLTEYLNKLGSTISGIVDNS